MANRCFTRHTLEGPRESIERYFDVLSSNTYLCDVAKEFGVSEKTYDTAGYVSYLSGEIEPQGELYSLSFDIDSKWAPCFVLFEVINHFVFNDKVVQYYCAEEPSCDLWWGNDVDGKYYPERYMLEYNGFWEDFVNDQELSEFFAKIFNKKFNNIDDVEKFIEEHNSKEFESEDCNYIILHKYDIEAIEERGDYFEKVDLS